MQHTPTAEQTEQMRADMEGAHDELGPIQVASGDVARLLIRVAIEEAIHPCPLADCAICNDDRALFWRLSNALPQRERIEYQRVLREIAVPLPAGPWEEELP